MGVRLLPLRPPKEAETFRSGVISRYSASAVLFFLAAAPASAQTFTFERSPAGDGVTVLDISTQRGKIHVSAGDVGRIIVAGNVTVRVDWHVPPDAPVLARNIAEHPPIELVGTTVRLRPPGDSRARNAVTVAYDVRVPPSTSLIAMSDSGAISAEDVSSAVSVRTQSGAITLARLNGDVQVVTGSGAVSVDDMQGGLHVTTQSSAMNLRQLRGALNVRTGSGSVGAFFAGPGDVDVRSRSSAIALEQVDGALIVATESGRVSVTGFPRRHWGILSGSSALDVAFAPGAPLTLDASTGSGSIQLESPLQGTVGKRQAHGTIGGPGAQVELTSRSGSIRVTQIGR
jgi:hypothetical protein